jgi:hypothetical protein
VPTTKIEPLASAPAPIITVLSSEPEANLDGISDNPLMLVLISLTPVVFLFVTIITVHRWRRDNR